MTGGCHGREPLGGRTRLSLGCEEPRQLLLEALPPFAARGLLLGAVAAAPAAAALLAAAAPGALATLLGHVRRVGDRRGARLAHALLPQALIPLVVFDAGSVIL